MALYKQIGVTMVLAALLAAGWLWLYGWGDDAKSKEPRPQRETATLVLVEPLAFSEDRTVLRAVGTGEARRSARIHPTVSGKVVAVMFNSERRVKKGTPLVRLDDTHERLAVRLAEVAVKEARRKVLRLERLVKSQTASTVALQEARTAHESAKLRLDQARADLADRTVRAPFDGVIGLPQVDPGDRVDDETMVATLDDRSTLLVEFVVPEEHTASLRVGAPIKVRPSTGGGQMVEGRISAADSRIDATTRTLRVQAEIPNREDAIRPGTSFDVEIDFKGRPLPAVREVAVLWSRDGAYLWRVTDGRAEKVFVKLVRREEGRVLVEGPLSPGDLIVVEGVQGLRDGQPLEPRPYGEDRTGMIAPHTSAEPA